MKIRVLGMILAIGLLAAGCGSTEKTQSGNEGDTKVVAKPPKKEKPSKPPVKKKKEPRPDEPLAEVTAKAKSEIPKQIAILKNKKSKADEKAKALEALIGIGPTASSAVLKLVGDKSTARLFLYVDRFFRNCPKGATDWLPWVLTSHKAKERAAAQMVLRSLCPGASVSLSSGADMKARETAAAAWKKILEERGVVAKPAK